MRRFLIKTSLIIAATLAAGAAQAQFTATLLEVSRAWGTATADYNGDGRDDIFITGHDPNDRIWFWTPAGYAPGPQVFPYVDRHDCAPADVNRDGRVDFFCNVGASGGDGVGLKEMWVARADGRHTKLSSPVLDDPYGRGRRAIFFDFNRDPWPDLYVAHLAEPRDDDRPNANRVLVNQGGTGAVEVATIATGQVGSACLDRGDVNQDGWDDLLVCNENGVARLYLNTTAGDFIELAAPALDAWTDAKLDDVNGDGRDDLLAIRRDNRFQIWLNTGSGGYYEAPAYADPLPGIGTALTVVDFDGNGLPDVFVVLQDALCPQTLVDVAPDRVYFGQGAGLWTPTVLSQTLRGCGSLVDTLDGERVVVMNGTVTRAGPNYVISYTPPAAQADSAAQRQRAGSATLQPADAETAASFIP